MRHTNNIELQGLF